MISREELENLATLSRLKLTEAEADKLRQDISSILDYVEQIGTVSRGDASTRGVSQGLPVPPAHCNVMRDDVEYPDKAMLLGKREALLAAFPRSERDYLVVQQILQKDE